MDNYLHQCPPMMNDGRGFTDYRSSHVREEIFKNDNRCLSENEARMLRIENAEKIMDHEWNYLKNNKSCSSQKTSFHNSPTTRVTTVYNNAEILAYNGKSPVREYNSNGNDYRMTTTNGNIVEKPKNKKMQHKSVSFAEYSKKEDRGRYGYMNRNKPERLYTDELQ